MFSLAPTYEDDELHEILVFRCTECGAVDVSLGKLHAHIERHRGYTRFGIQLPLTKTAMANVDELMKRTQILRVEDYSEVSKSEVEIRA
jgi:hypothetical protein